MIPLGNLGKRLFGHRLTTATSSAWPDRRRDQRARARARGAERRPLAARTPGSATRLEAGETLDDLLVEAFATVREAAKRTLGQRHFDVQLIGGIVLHAARSPR